MTVLVTGAAGFIGAHLTQRLCLDGHEVVGVDRMSDYYSPELKKYRLETIVPEQVDFRILDLRNYKETLDLIREIKPHTIFHLAAQPGIRLPVEQYSSYIGDNIQGFQNILTSAVENHIPNFLYASSSSVYGNSDKMNLSEDENNLSPISFYGKSKLLNELMVSTFTKGTATRSRGLRFFTVYGPFGRPDMAYFRLIGKALVNSPFVLFGDGTVLRDLTYIDDVVEALERLGDELITHPLGYSDVVNVGGGNPVSMNEMIETISVITGKRLTIDREAKNKNDMDYTCAAITNQVKLINWKPTKTLKYGLENTIRWMQQEVDNPELIKWLNPE